uniref:Uncharacterized protein n=1 Tax=Streptomyces sp. NBC_00093 TaxID=2975649 RepID=A0AAU2AB09_9ACTN
MSDEQIALMARSLDIMARTLRDKPGTSDNTCDAMFEGLASDVRNLAAQNPERVKELVGALTRSENSADRELAVTSVESLIGYDYVFTRETLLHLYLDRYDHEDRGGVGEAAISVLHRLSENTLTPEQLADFNMCLRFRGGPEL